MSLADNKLDDFNGCDGDTLEKKSRKDLVGYIEHLRNKVEELVSYRLISQRVKNLEQNILRSLQYQRREKKIYKEKKINGEKASKFTTSLKRLPMTNWKIPALIFLVI